MFHSYISLLYQDKTFGPLLTPENKTLSGLGGASAKTFFAAGLLEKSPMPVVWIVSDSSLIQEVVSLFRIWSPLPIFGIFEESSQTVWAKCMYFLNQKKPAIIVTTEELVKSFPVLSSDELSKKVLDFHSGESMKMVDFFELLISRGYESVLHDVEIEGQYFRKGSLIDVYPIGYEKPIRMEFVGDVLDSIYEYELLTKKILGTLKNFTLFPAKVDGRHALPFYFDTASLILDELNHETPFEPNVGKCQIVFDPFVGEDTIDMSFHSVLRYNTALGFVADIQEKLGQNWNVAVFTENKKEVAGLLKDSGLLTHPKLNIVEKRKKDHIEDHLGFEIYPDGFINHHLKLFVVTEREIFNIQRKHLRSKKAEVDAAFLANLHQGDFVVHFDHGVGRFMGIQKKTVSEVTKEYLFIEYAHNDKLFVPVDQAEKVNKYIGVDGSEPKLTRLGSAEWVTMTKKIREEALILAKELLELYAKREEAKGFAFPLDTPLQHEFETAFAYEPTDGQLSAIAEVKKDMESSRPMDRLLCGDVGFGKTEVAMRAAFKAVQAGKQVVFLAPITILCNQHYKTLMKRMSSFGVRIAELSRFRTSVEQKEVLQQLQKGQVDIVVGTHALLSEQVKFKNLGLIIIDEEQRFGVKQKEKLKNSRVDADILTLTATPIPRTLNMALSGLRDISTIMTPPPGRLPIHTEVRRFSMSLIREVIMKELERDGQVYFLHNRVQTIESITEKLQLLVPEAKYVVAHGQLSPHELEKRIMDFKEKKFNVLVSSTIIENGIDFENANTLIVDQAENLGLAQAYQLRGRVGRGKRQAYAYFLYHAQKLQDDAKKRLRAIIEASDLGSGFQIAMRDLEIRGAGDVLGAKQHGAINAVGVTHFCRLLAKTIDDLRSGKLHEASADDITADVKIDLKLSAYIPDDFIPKAMEKIRYYQRLSGVENEEDLKDIEQELIDTYGPIPSETINLIKILEMKLLAKRRGVIGIREVDYEDKAYIELVLGKTVSPKAIINLLNHTDKWMIIESKLKIALPELGRDWLAAIKRSLFELKE